MSVVVDSGSSSSVFGGFRPPSLESCSTDFLKAVEGGGPVTTRLFFRRGRAGHLGSVAPGILSAVAFDMGLVTFSILMDGAPVSKTYDPNRLCEQSHLLGENLRVRRDYKDKGIAVIDMWFLEGLLSPLHASRGNRVLRVYGDFF